MSKERIDTLIRAGHYPELRLNTPRFCASGKLPATTLFAWVQGLDVFPGVVWVGYPNPLPIRYGRVWEEGDLKRVWLTYELEFQGWGSAIIQGLMNGAGECVHVWAKSLPDPTAFAELTGLMHLYPESLEWCPLDEISDVIDRRLTTMLLAMTAAFHLQRPDYFEGGCKPLDRYLAEWLHDGGVPRMHIEDLVDLTDLTTY